MASTWQPFPVWRHRGASSTRNHERRVRTVRRRGNAQNKTLHWRLEPLEPRLLLSDVDWSGLGDGTSWDDANNWLVDGTSSGVPQDGDDVTIDVADDTAVVFDSGATNVAVASLSTNAPFSISSRTLTVNGPSNFDAGLNTC